VEQRDPRGFERVHRRDVAFTLTVKVIHERSVPRDGCARVDARGGARIWIAMVRRSIPNDGFAEISHAVQGSLGEGTPTLASGEIVNVLASSAGVRIERIVSHGHASPSGFWYDQEEDEFVLLVSGAARLEVEGEGEVVLAAGDWIDLPRHLRHRVTWTPPDRDTIWLAVYRGGSAARSGGGE